MTLDNKIVKYINLAGKQVQRITMLGSTVYQLDVPVGHSLSIAGPTEASGETVQLGVLYDNESLDPISATWTIISGNATVSGGLIMIPVGAQTSSVTVGCSYQGLSASHNIELTYAAGSTSETTTETVTDPDTGETTTVIETVTENPDGSSTTSTETTVTDENGNIVGSTETEQTVSAPDPATGSVTTQTTTVNYDENGDTTGSQSNTTVNNTDGSSSSTTTNYNSAGDPTDQTNQEIDSDGNNSTQNIEFDENLVPTVTSYDIDTTGSESGEKNFNGDGVNTQFYGFDATRGFVLDFHFTINFKQQPAGQNENHHNILTMKRSSPEPWYGFQLRHTSTNTNIIIGTQFSTGSNTNTTIAATATDTANVYEYNLRVTYDPIADTDSFICRNMITGVNIFTSDKKFPDIPELEYLTVCIGYALDANEQPYRYSNINVINFSISKLSRSVAQPVITCDGQHVTITCETQGATIYYRTGGTGNFVAYSTPIPILSDTLVEAYSVLDDSQSDTVSMTCVYDDGIEEPVIYCDGETVSINCETPGADIYYRIGTSGEWILYTEAFFIAETVTVQSYSDINGATSQTVSQTCTYSPVTLYPPIISFDGTHITVVCSTNGASIWYRLDQEGEYTQYFNPISINEDTVIEAYSQYNNRTSSVVTETCEYSPGHDYSQDYLTFVSKTAGSVAWKSVGSGQEKTIQYSKNGGEWTSLTASSTPETINVSVGDIVRFKGTNAAYAKDKSNYSGFEGGTASVDIEGNIMSLVYGDNFASNSTLAASYAFCSIFKLSNVISAENLVLPATVLTQYCYRAMFSLAPYLEVPPKLPATALAQGCYWYMFEACPITEAPELPATELVRECYGNMFINCSSLNYIKCLAVTGFSTTNCKQNWVKGVSSTGTFVKDSSVTTSTWSTGINGIPTSWIVYDDVAVSAPEITYDGFDSVTISCDTVGAAIYYRTDSSAQFSVYSTPITISSDTTVEAYSSLNGQVSRTVEETCLYISSVPLEASNRDINTWKFSGQSVTVPYSVNRLDGHSSGYAKGTFNFEADVPIRTVQPTYLWFQHADQSAQVYIDNNLVEKHWGGYTAFFMDITNHIHVGTNRIKVSLKNNEGNYLAPAGGDFNFNATLGKVKLLTSPCLPDMSYGYDGMHITSTVTSSSATVYVKTRVPSGVNLSCTITDGTHTFSDTDVSDGTEVTFTDIISNPHLWNGKSDPHLYTVTLELSKDGSLYHRFIRPYGLRFYSYVINDTSVLQSGDPYTGFLLNGSPYLLRGVCMHDDVDGKANALDDADYTQEFNIIQELGCNFIRLAHYPHPKEVYDRCDQLGIIVQTEGPCVNKLQSTMPEDYYTHLSTQYTEMVNQHYNHPCIMFWGLSNETTTDDKDFGKAKIEAYTTLIKNLDGERMVGYVMSHSYPNPSAYYNNPAVDWFGCNIYVGWYIDKASNDPTSQLNTRVTNIITNARKALAFSEYGAGGTQRCHSENPQTTTTKGNYERHDIEYQMWLHEGHLAAIRNFPQLMFTSEWQLFDIAVANRNEGYTVCLDGENASIDDELRRLNNKGLVERDHIHKKDTFYLYKAEWNATPFVHICGKDYTKKTDRAIKCYTNDGNTLTMKVNGTTVGTAAVTDHTAVFSAATFNTGDIVTVSGASESDTLEF